ncbi:hypothetical protein F5887DRAFT_1077002 [Amanita rubescens]|nr:hypothetical protein F5887DRAFT_1077002 [Amanita rubescens]
MEMTKNAMDDGATHSGHSDPNRTTNDTLGVNTDVSAARLSSHVPTVPSSTDLSSIDPSSALLNPAMNKRTAENAMFDAPVPNYNDSSSNRTTNDTPGAQRWRGGVPFQPCLDPSSSAPITRMQLRSKICRVAKRYKEKQMRLAKEAMAGSPLTECNHSDPNPTTNDAPGVEDNNAPA